MQVGWNVLEIVHPKFLSLFNSLQRRYMLLKCR